MPCPKMLFAGLSKLFLIHGYKSITNSLMYLHKHQWKRTSIFHPFFVHIRNFPDAHSTNHTLGFSWMFLFKKQNFRLHTLITHTEKKKSEVSEKNITKHTYKHTQRREKQRERRGMRMFHTFNSLKNMLLRAHSTIEKSVWSAILHMRPKVLSFSCLLRLACSCCR